MQDYKNHTRYYIPHHVVFYPLTVLLIAYCIRGALKTGGDAAIWIIAAIAFFMMGWLSFMLRQHYALTLQNRMVIQEMRLRYFVLTGKRFELFEQKLSFAQIAALRFASDEEISDLVTRTIREHLTPEEIKKAIKNWLPDNQRV